MAAARAEYPLRLDAAFGAQLAAIRRERLVQFAAPGRGVHAQLVAIRIGHLLENFNECEKCTLMQLGISWWREVCVCPPIFVNESPRNYMEVIASDRLDAVQQATPLAMGLATLLPVGYHILDGQLYHES